jgi:hypothetical protein
MKKDQLLKDFNEKVQTLKLQALFVNFPDKMKSFFESFQVTDAFEVDVLGEYSDEGHVLDYAFEIEFEDERFILGLELDYNKTRNQHTYIVAEDWEQSDLTEYLGVKANDWQQTREMNNKASEIFNTLDFAGLAKDIRQAVVNDGKEKNKSVLVGQKVIDVEYDPSTMSYIAKLENGEVLTYQKEERQLYEQHL